MHNISELMEDSIDYIKINHSSNITCVKSGFDEFDKATNGFHNSELIVFASRPSMGKTSFITSLIRNIMYDKVIGCFSLEMSKEKFIQRILSQETEIQFDKLNSGKLADYEWKRLLTKASEIENRSNIIFIDTPKINIKQLIEEWKKMVIDKSVECIFIDYLQLIEPNPSEQKFANREQEISYIIRELKHLSRILDIPIIVTSHLSREVEKRGNTRRPLLSDLRDSGAIEDHADLVGFIYRPEYYKLEYWDDESELAYGQGEIIIAKNRNGSLFNFRLRFDNCGRFSELVNTEYDSDLSSSMNIINPESAFGLDDNFFSSNLNDEDDNIPF